MCIQLGYRLNTDVRFYVILKHRYCRRVEDDGEKEQEHYRERDSVPGLGQAQEKAAVPELGSYSEPAEEPAQAWD
jgi:hypothetical protein